MLNRSVKATIAGLAALFVQPVTALQAEAYQGQDTTRRACPVELDRVATCYDGRDANGAWYLVAIPNEWNRVLVVHAHGGPRLGAPKKDDSDEDLERFASIVRQGYAWIGSTYRRGGYGVRMAAEDVDNSRAIFWKNFGKPHLTILHGQSYGGNVAAKLAELGSINGSGEALYNGVLLTNGVLRGGVRAYDFRAHLRAVYQYFCKNHPRPDEAQYPLWQGLPRDSRMTKADLQSRVDACLGLNLPQSQRTTDQLTKLASITGATGIPEAELLRHLEWATFTFQDLVQSRLDGLNPFDNSRTEYQGSSDDAGLNRDVERFTADPSAVTKLAYDSDLTGIIVVPTIAVHWVDDPIVPATGDREYQAKVTSHGNGDLFLSIWTSKGTHSRLSTPDLVSALEAVVASAEKGSLIDLEKIMEMCRSIGARTNQDCTMLR